MLNLLGAATLIPNGADFVVKFVRFVNPTATCSDANVRSCVGWLNLALVVKENAPVYTDCQAKFWIAFDFVLGSLEKGINLILIPTLSYGINQWQIFVHASGLSQKDSPRGTTWDKWFLILDFGTHCEPFSANSHDSFGHCAPTNPKVVIPDSFIIAKINKKSLPKFADTLFGRCPIEHALFIFAF